jgi:hypothetical protein
MDMIVIVELFVVLGYGDVVYCLIVRYYNLRCLS